jgi:hypothetical protein
MPGRASSHQIHRWTPRPASSLDYTPPTLRNRCVTPQVARSSKVRPGCLRTPRPASVQAVYAQLPATEAIPHVAAENGNGGRQTPRQLVPSLHAGVFNGSNVPTPWGAERANNDNPPRELIQQRQGFYRQLLDEQAAKKADQRRAREEELAAIDRTTSVSLATKTHDWGLPDSDGTREKQMSKEHLAVASYRKIREFQLRKKEEFEMRAWAAESERENAILYHQKKQRNMQVLNSLTEEWRVASEEKQRQRELHRLAELQAEREARDQLLVGMVPPRRLRKPFLGVF